MRCAFCFLYGKTVVSLCGVTAESLCGVPVVSLSGALVPSLCRVPSWNIIYLCGVPVESTCGVPAVSLYTVYLFCCISLRCTCCLPPRCTCCIVPRCTYCIHRRWSPCPPRSPPGPPPPPPGSSAGTRRGQHPSPRPNTTASYRGEGGGATSTASNYSRNTLLKPFLRGRESGFEILVRFVMYYEQFWTSVLRWCKNNCLHNFDLYWKRNKSLMQKS